MMEKLVLLMVNREYMDMKKEERREAAFAMRFAQAKKGKKRTQDEE
jgi:hypothetical protein